MKLQSKRNQNKKVVLLILAAIVVLAVVVALVIGIVSTVQENNKEPAAPVEQEIIIASYPVLDYYVGDVFNPTGLKIQVITDSNETTYFVDHTKVQISGFDSSVPNEELVLTVTYKTFTTTLTVSIKNPPAAEPTLASIRLSDNFVSSYPLDWWNTYGPSFDKVKLICTYSDGTEKTVALKSEYCYGINYNLESAGTTEFTVKYSENGIKAECTVTVTITE